MEAIFTKDEMGQHWADSVGYPLCLGQFKYRRSDSYVPFVQVHVYADENGTPIAFDVDLDTTMYVMKRESPEVKNLFVDLVQQACNSGVPGMKLERVEKDSYDWFDFGKDSISKRSNAATLATLDFTKTTTDTSFASAMHLYDLTDQPDVQKEFEEDLDGSVKSLCEQLADYAIDVVLEMLEIHRKDFLEIAIAHQERLNAKKANKGVVPAGSTFTVWHDLRNGYMDCDRKPMRGVTSLESITPDKVSWVPFLDKNGMGVESKLNAAGYLAVEYGENPFGDAVVYVPTIKVQVDDLKDSGRHSMIYNYKRKEWVLLDQAKKEAGVNMSANKFGSSAYSKYANSSAYSKYANSECITDYLRYTI